MRDIDQLERRLMHDGLELFVTFPVTIGFLDHDVALEQETF